MTGVGSLRQSRACVAQPAQARLELDLAAIVSDAFFETLKTRRLV